MTELDFKKPESSPGNQSNKAIQSLFEEIKEFENIFPEYEIKEPEFIEIDSTKVEGSRENIDESPILNIEENVANELKKMSLKYKLKKLKLIKIKRRKTILDETNQDKTKDLHPTIINIGFNDQGELVNLDLRKPKETPKTNKFEFLKKLNFRKGKKAKSKKTKGESKESEGSKLSKFKSVFGKIGNLKKAIPHKGSKKDKEE